jgi:hypothetical protein
MQITRNSLDMNPGRSDWFTGAVYVDTIAGPPTKRAHGKRIRTEGGELAFDPRDRVALALPAA